MMNKDNDKIEYFSNAKNWADDLYTVMIASRNRYRMAFIIISVLAICLTIAIIMMIPLEHTELVVVHQPDHGVIWVEPTHQRATPKNRAQIESELIHYVINRESYHVTSYHEQYLLVNLMSDSMVAKGYVAEQDSQNKNSPINLLGNRGYRGVRIQNIIFLDNTRLDEKSKHQSKQQHYNLAQVNFEIIDHHSTTDKIKRKSLTVLISWVYRGTPKNPSDKWRNWDGFTVTRYDVQQRSI